MTVTHNSPDPSQLSNFGAAIYSRIFESPFGSLPKTELEIILFTELVRTRIIDIESTSIFELARKLRCSPSKASNLIFNYRLREAPNELEETQDKLAAVTRVVTNRKNSADGEVTLNIEDRFWRDELVNQLKRVNVFTDTSFNRERITLDEKLFYKACPDLFGPAGKEIAEAAKRASSKKGKLAKQLMVGLATGATTKVGAIAAQELSGGMTISEIAKTISDVLP